MRCLLTLLLLSIPCLPAYSWEMNYAQVLEASQHDQKPILLFFNGSDWSGLAMKMKNEVLDADSFQKNIQEHFHCIEVDFPEHTALSDAEKNQNAALKKRFRVEEFPQLVLVDSQERVIVRMGYFPESGEQLAAELLEIVSQDRELCQGLKALPQKEEPLRRLYQLAQILSRPDAEKTLLATGVDLEIPFFLLEQYRHCIEAGKNAAHLRKKLEKSTDHQVHFTLAIIDFQERAATMQDPREVIKPLEAYLERFSDKDPQNVWRIEMMIAQFYLDADEWGTALQHAETAFQTAPSAMRPEIENSLNYIQHQLR